MKAACLCQPISWSMVIMLCDSVVFIVVTNPADNHEKINSWVSFFPYNMSTCMVLCLAALQATEAPL